MDQVRIDAALPYELHDRRPRLKTGFHQIPPSVLRNRIVHSLIALRPVAMPHSRLLSSRVQAISHGHDLHQFLSVSPDVIYAALTNNCRRFPLWRDLAAVTQTRAASKQKARQSGLFGMHFSVVRLE